MTQLHEILAAQGTVNNRALQAVSAVQEAFRKAPRLQGLTRHYQPTDDLGERLPSESVIVQTTVPHQLAELQKALTPAFDLAAQRDWTNTAAKAALKVDGTIIIDNVPVTYLMDLQHRLVELRTLFQQTPVLDPTENWRFDETRGYWVTNEVVTTRTKKIPRNHVKAEATERHPAQVDVYYEDVIVGNWYRTHSSGMLPPAQLALLLARTDNLLTAVQVARAAANSAQVISPPPVGKALFDYLYRGIL